MTGVAGPGNWGRWGADDERGTLNLVDADTVRRAAAGVSTGEIYQLGIPVDHRGPVFPGRITPQHYMTVDGADYTALGRDHGYADDVIVMNTQGSSHLDALAHVWTEGTLYNGHSMAQVRSSGAARCGIDKFGALATRAHLFSFADGATTSPGVISAEDIQRQLAKRETTVGPGDAILLHTGWMDTWVASRVDDPTHPVLSLEAARWLAECDVSLVGADNPAVEAAGEDDVHMHLIHDHGIHLMELIDLSLPASAQVTGGMLVVAPLRITRGVGSPVNPVLIT